MRLSSLVPRSKHSAAFLCVIAAAHVVACGDDTSNDDESAPEAGSLADSGSSTDEGFEDETTEISEPPDAGTVRDSGSSESSCQRVDEACSGFDDPVDEGLAELCLRVAAQESVEQCQAVEADCLLYCAPDSDYEEPPLDGELACNQMGDLCHDADDGTGLENLCHETGHSENPAWCLAIYDECQTVCDGLGQSDAGSGAHTDGGHSDSDGGDAGSLQALTLEFRAVFGDEPFACGQEYAGQGAEPTTVTPSDLRFYVSDVRLINAQGEQVPFELDELSPYQGGGVSLLDFEDGSGACINGDPGTNTSVVGKVPAGDYVGIVFSTSVPFELNHADPTTLPAPLQAGSMSWGWLLGYKFFVAEVSQVLELPAEAGADAGADAAAPVSGLGLLHLGSTECVNEFGVDGGVDFGSPPTTQCGKPNRNEIELADFTQGSAIVLDLEQLFAATDLTVTSMCHSAGEACPALFDSAGVDFESGEPSASQSMFRVE